MKYFKNLIKLYIKKQILKYKFTINLHNQILKKKFKTKPTKIHNFSNHKSYLLCRRDADKFRQLSINFFYCTSGVDV